MFSGVIFSSEASPAAIISSVRSALRDQKIGNHQIADSASIDEKELVQIRHLIVLPSNDYTMGDGGGKSTRLLSWAKKCNVDVQHYLKSGQQTERIVKEMSIHIERLVHSGPWRLEVDYIWQTMNCYFIRELLGSFD